MTGPSLVYVLCMVTGALCAALLVRAYWRTKMRLLLWSAISFVFLAINNLFLFLDVVVVGPTIDLLPFRYLASFAAVAVMVYGLIWEAE